MYISSLNQLFKHFDILIVAETKLDTSSPKSRFLMPGFYKLFWLDVTAKSGCLLVRVKGPLPVS